MNTINLAEIKNNQDKIETYINPLVSRKRVEWVAYNFKLSNHAEFRQIQRDTILNRDFKNCIRNSPLCWKSIEGTIYIALDLYYYIVVDDRTGEPIIVTFADARENPRGRGANVFEMAMFEYKQLIKKMKGV